MKKKFDLLEGQNVPEHWYQNSWEEKARENPLFAVMTTPDLIDADPENFTEAHLGPFFEKGKRVFVDHVKPAIELSAFEKNESLLVDYGCGVGRVLRAVVEAGYACAGVDISATMLHHCRRLAPGVKSLHLLDENKRCDLESECATVVFSFAVVKHIARLAEFSIAVAEMCRLLKPRGILALNVNCQDFIGGDLARPERTENFETHSLHYAPGAGRPYKKRVYSTWSGVHIGFEPLKQLLQAGGVEVLKTYYHTAKKPKGIWVIGRKRG